MRLIIVLALLGSFYAIVTEKNYEENNIDMPQATYRTGYGNAITIAYNNKAYADTYKHLTGGSKHGY